MSNLELRPRIASEIVDAAFQLYLRHFAELVSLSAMIFAPFVVVQILLTGGRPVEATTGTSTALTVMLFGWVIGSVIEAAIVVAVSNSYLRGSPDVSDALRRTFSRFWRVLFGVTSKWILVGLGFVATLFVVLIVAVIAFAATGGAAADAAPNELIAGSLVVIVMVVSLPVALYLFARYFAVPATIVLEGLGIRAGLRRSAELSRGIKPRILGALGVSMIAFVVLQLMIVAVLQAVLPGPRIFPFLIEQAISVIGYPIIAVIATLLYYDARIRREGFDIEMMAAELAPAAGAMPAEQSPLPPA